MQHNKGKLNIPTPDTYAIGTVSVINGSSVVTGTDTNWSTLLPYLGGYLFQITADTEIYTIRNIINDTTLHLDREYDGETTTEPAEYIMTYIVFIIEGINTFWAHRIKPGQLVKSKLADYIYKIEQLDEINPDTKLHITTPYQGAVATNLDYLIAMSLSPNIGLTFLTKGDKCWTSLIERNFKLIDKLVNSNHYEEGTISVVQNNSLIIGNDTTWLDYIQAGDILYIPSSGVEYIVKRIRSNIHIELTTEYTEISNTNEDYIIIYKQAKKRNVYFIDGNTENNVETVLANILDDGFMFYNSVNNVPSIYTGTEFIQLNTEAPVITSITPNSGVVGDVIRIAGNYFGRNKHTSIVEFNGIEGYNVSIWDEDDIEVVIPTGAETGNVVVTVNNKTSNAMPFTVS